MEFKLTFSKGSKKKEIDSDGVHALVRIWELSLVRIYDVVISSTRN